MSRASASPSCDRRLRVAVVYGGAIQADALVDATVYAESSTVPLTGAELAGVPLLERLRPSSDGAVWVLNWTGAMSGWVRWRGREWSLRDLSWRPGVSMRGEVMVRRDGDEPHGGRWRPESCFTVPLGGDDWGVLRLGGAEVVFQFVRPLTRRREGRLSKLHPSRRHGRGARRSGPGVASVNRDLHTMESDRRRDPQPRPGGREAPAPTESGGADHEPGSRFDVGMSSSGRSTSASATEADESNQRNRPDADVWATAGQRLVAALGGAGSMAPSMAWLGALGASLIIQGTVVVGAMWPVPAASEDTAITVASYRDGSLDRAAPAAPVFVASEIAEVVEEPRSVVERRRLSASRVRAGVRRAVSSVSGGQAFRRTGAPWGVVARADRGFWAVTTSHAKKNDRIRNLRDEPMSNEVRRQ